MDAIITAGGIPEPEDPLYSYTQGKSKALVDIAGKPMVQWILDALNEAESVDTIVIVSLDESNGLQSIKPVAYVPDQGGMLNNIRAGTQKLMEVNPKAVYTLAVSSDIPSITGKMVDWVVTTAMQSEDQLYYNVISKDVMEKRFPGANRSYIRLSDAEVCGGDMNVFKLSMVTSKEGFWNKLIDARKNIFKQAALIGYDTLILLALRRLSLQGAQKIVCERLRINGRLIICPFAEVAMDVDKPHQYELIQKAMSGLTAL